LSRHKPLYAAVVTATSIGDALLDLEDIQKERDVIDLVELRIDYLRDLTPSSLTCLLETCKTYHLPALVTNRVRDEGGYFEGDEEQRIGYLQEAIKFGADYVDIELNHYPAIKKEQTKLIVSYHNFAETPSLSNLRAIQNSMAETHADIYKIVTYPKTRDDVQIIKQLINESQGDVIFLSLGELGRETRLNPKNYLTFLALEAEKGSAPGQPTIAEIRAGARVFNEVFLNQEDLM
jgi:3-dehydroquinate dehydratase/shikimate dehydrogenase